MDPAQMWAAFSIQNWHSLPPFFTKASLEMEGGGERWESFQREDTNLLEGNTKIDIFFFRCVDFKAVQCEGVTFSSTN